MANLEALEISLSDEQINYLESVVPFDPGFPNWMIVSCAFFFSPSIGNSTYVILFLFYFAFSAQGTGQENGPLINTTATITKGPLIQPLRP